MDDQSHKTHKSRSVGNKASKKALVQKKKKGIDTEPNRGSNFKAFAGASMRSRKNVAAARGEERRGNNMTLPSRDRSLRTLVQEPPLLVAVVGPPGCGKSTLIRSMVKFYTHRNISKLAGSITVVVGRARRVTFIECPPQLSAMCDLAKVCDLAIIMVDGAFGFELETFEFLSIAQTHGFPKVIGVISKLDLLKTNKALKKTKRMLRHRFWHEVSAGASIMCLAPLIRGGYRPADVLKLHRSLVTIEPKMQLWRSSHSCVFIDRHEDVTNQQLVAKDPNASRSIAFYGYVRGKPINGPGDKFHVPGLGDVTVANISRQPDPCEAVDSKATSQGSKMRTLGAKHKRCYAPYCNIGGVEFDEDGIYVTEDVDRAHNVERRGAGLEMMREMQRGVNSLDEMKKDRNLRVLEEGDDHGDDSDTDDNNQNRRKVKFANEDTLDLEVGNIESGSDDDEDDDGDSSSSDDGDDDIPALHTHRRQSGKKRGQKDSDDYDDDDDDDSLGGYGNVDDGDDVVKAFAGGRDGGNHSSSSASASFSLRPLKPFDRDSGRVSQISSTDWFEESNRRRLKRLFVTGRAATGAGDEAGRQDDDDGELNDKSNPNSGDEENDAENGNYETDSAGYESVDSDEANDPSLFTASAAASSHSKKSSLSRKGRTNSSSLFSDDDADGFDDDSDESDDEHDDDGEDEDDVGEDEDGDDRRRAKKVSSGGKKKNTTTELSDDLQQYVDFFVARDDGGKNNTNNKLTKSGTGKGISSSSSSSGPGGNLLLDETDALVSSFKNSNKNYDDDDSDDDNNNKNKKKRGKKSRGDDDDDDDDDEHEGGEKEIGGDGAVDEDYIRKKMEKKKLFDEGYDTTGGKNNTTAFYHHLLDEERDRQRNIEDTLADVGEDIDKRVEVVGYFSGLYVRFVVHNVPVEFVRNFDPRTPVIAGGINPGEDRQEVVHTRFLRHRWYPKILKAQDPITISIGWRRIQVQPLYATEDGNGRWRYLKYTPKHMHCLAAFYGPVVPPNTGFIVIPTVEAKSTNFRCMASGYTVGVDAATHIVKKLKITGVPESIHKTTCFVKGMFNSDIEAARFVGAKVKTVSGLRGSIKKVMKGKHGLVRCTFEDKLLRSDICFIRTWKPVEVPRYCEVVPTLLVGAAGEWKGMRTMAQIRREEGIELKWKKDSEYRDITRRANADDDASLVAKAPVSALVSRSTRMDLPFDLREEFIPLKQRSDLEQAVRAETVVAPEKRDIQRHALLNMFREKSDHMKEKKMATKTTKKKAVERRKSKETERHERQVKKAKKETARKVEFRSQHKSRNKK